MADLKGLSPGDHAFITVGITLDEGPRNSVFDLAGSAIIVQERPDSYGMGESDTGSRVACGVIRR